jgi:hypothetical protein
MKVGERLNNIINHLNHNISSFSKSIGLSNNVTLMRNVKGDSTPSFSTLQKIKASYPEINIEWLISGEGEMIKESSKNNEWFQNALEKAQRDIEWHKELISTLQRALDNQTRLINNEKDVEEILEK